MNASTALTKIAAECHRTKWQFDKEEDRKAFEALHRIGDEALKLRDQLYHNRQENNTRGHEGIADHNRQWPEVSRVRMRWL